MTAECLAKIEKMNKRGLNDTIIAEALCYSPCVVSKCRRKLGLPIAGTNRTKKRYAIYDGETTQYIMEGTAKECAKYMGIKTESFYCSKIRFEQGIYKKYEIYEVEGEA